MKRISTYEQGFTLIEILIAITVFAIGILAVGKMQITAIQGNSRANQLTEAVTLAQSKIEELISLNYNDPLLADGDLDGTNRDGNDDGIDDSGNDFGLNDDNNTIGNADGTDQYQIPGNLQYNIFWNIAPDEPTTDTKIIRVIVTWRSHGGLMRKVSFDAVKARI